MKKLLVILAGFVVLQACNPGNENKGESGTVNDGFQGAGDPSGGLSGDTVVQGTDARRSIDTAADDHRVDTWKRDSAGQRQ
ncbi:MAG TPA: hypothetical protein VGE66_08735 [Chitinophagaceae bacterium]